MATGQYIGVDGVARKVTFPYVGVDGVARNITSGYVGVDGVARLFFAPEGGGAVVLEVEKITSDTYVNETAYIGEEFILLDIYPKTGGTVNVTYGGLTKTITDTSGAETPNAQKVFFGTFNGVSDSVTTPASGELVIRGDCLFACGKYGSLANKTDNATCGCITHVADWGELTEIAFGAFDSCAKLTLDILPDSITRIGDLAFTACTSLTSVTIPESVTHMGGCFGSCEKLESIIMLATTPPVLKSETYVLFTFSKYSTNIIVPKGCGATYKAADGWRTYADYIVEAS